MYKIVQKKITYDVISGGDAIDWRQLSQIYPIFLEGHSLWTNKATKVGDPSNNCYWYVPSITTTFKVLNYDSIF